MKHQSPYLSIELKTGHTRKRLTHVWDVYAKTSGERLLLGHIEWWTGWRRYAFNPMPNTVFEHECLRFLADFCDEASAQHVAARKRMKA